jgi:hypothetical protein
MIVRIIAKVILVQVVTYTLDRIVTRLDNPKKILPKSRKKPTRKS